MNVTFAPRGILQIDDANIIFPNFSGEPDKFNREGDRNFAIRFYDEDLVNELIDRGWNVRVKPPREEGDDPFMYLPVKIKFNDRGPIVRLESGDNVRELNENTIGNLDNINIRTVDMDIRPYHWEVNGKQGCTAYLQNLYVVQDRDRFADRLRGQLISAGVEIIDDDDYDE